MKTYNEMAENALKRIAEQKNEQQKKRRKVLKIAVPAVSGCLVVLLGFGVWKTGMLPGKVQLPDNTTPTMLSQETTALTQETTFTADESVSSVEKETTDVPAAETTEATQIVVPTEANTASKEEVSTAAPDNEAHKGAEVADNAMLWWHNRWNVSGSLYYAMENDPNGVFSVTASYHPVTSEITDFVYEGKTLAEWAVASEDARFTLQKMHELLKQGEELKYGSALYETGTPDGIKWDKNFYEERIKYFGSLTDKYIVNGEFLHEQLSRDITEYDTETVLETYALAYNVYLESFLPGIISQLRANGIACERAAYSLSGITLSVTPEQLSSLPLENASCWSFSLTDRAAKGIPCDDNSIVS